ncbi:hypothetical protein [Micromonospora sp. URMC 103]|uniref:hypothetical protein n=1 Tax=Micromonospora sp. URMC 103 TaxID=3423406 RepID=UPI003F1C6348
MSVEAHGTRPAVATAGTAPSLDYYLILDASGGTAEALVVEEFLRAPDWSTTGLDSAVWTPSAGWGGSAAFSRGMRADPQLRARTLPVARDAADAAHRWLGGGPLPDERALRTRFQDRQAFPATAPLRLGVPQAPHGRHERRVYRVLFAGDLPPDRVARLAAHWRPVGAPPPVDGMPAGRRRVDGDDHRWTLRRIGGGIAWCVDLTVDLATATDATVGPVLHELTTAVRLAGLIPATTERFA